MSPEVAQLARHPRSGLQQNVVARDEPARVGAARDAGAGGVEARGRASQHLGNRRARGVLEVRGGAPIHGRRARVVSTERIELVSAAADARGQSSDTAWKADLDLLDDMHDALRDAVDAAVGEGPVPHAARKESQQLRAALGCRRPRSLPRRTDSASQAPVVRGRL